MQKVLAILMRIFFVNLVFRIIIKSFFLELYTRSPVIFIVQLLVGTGGKECNGVAACIYIWFFYLKKLLHGN